MGGVGYGRIARRLQRRYGVYFPYRLEMSWVWVVLVLLRETQLAVSPCVSFFALVSLCFCLLLR